MSKPLLEKEFLNVLKKFGYQTCGIKTIYIDFDQDPDINIQYRHTDKMDKKSWREKFS